MKKLLLALFALPAMVFAQGGTSVNFDTASEWIQGGTTAFGSYGNHGYAITNFQMEGTSVIRETAANQDGHPAFLGTYAIRVKNEANAKVIFTIPQSGVSNFSFKVRRWDGNPLVVANVSYSVDGGATYTTLSQQITDAWLDASSVFKTYNGVINSTAANIKIKVDWVSGERFMIDDFYWEPGTVPTECTITSAPLTGLTCDDNGTPTIENDDNIKFTLTPTAVLGAATYNVTVPAGYTIVPTSASYGTATEFTLSRDGGAAGQGNVVVTLTDADSVDCSVNVTVEDLGICSSANAVLSTSVTTLAIGNYTLPFASPVANFTFSGLTLSGDVTVTANGNYVISKDNQNFAASLTYALGEATAMTDSIVYVRSTATAAGVNEGTIVVSTNNATDKTVTVSTTVSEYVPMTFAQVQTNGSDNKPVNLNTKVAVRGTTACQNFYSSSRYNFYIFNENQESIYIFKNPSLPYYTFSAGDSLVIYGSVGFYNGLTQIIVDSITNLGQALFTDFVPTPLTGEMTEAVDSKFMILEDVAFTTPTATWPTNGNVTVAKDGIEYIVRVVTASDLSGQATPTTPTFSIIGFVQQYTSTAPYLDGYQFYPCSAASIIPGEFVECPNPATGAVTVDPETKTITATDEDASYTYQWAACGPNAPQFPDIMFATGRSFTPTISGSYLVKVMNSNVGCSTVESECIEVTISGVGVNNVLATTTAVYPNPFNTSLTIVSEKAVSFNVLDVQGKTVSTSQEINGSASINTESWLQGVYFIQLVGANAETHTVKVIK